MAQNIPRIEEFQRKIEKLERDLVYYRRELELCTNDDLRLVILTQIRDTTQELRTTMQLSREAYEAASANMEKALKEIDKRNKRDGQH